ncbi:uncharacterized protein NEMAJ01_0449 [Nematocida major]|uniref:uncharacterized protein n=1 Tax=Nematocida major TaxID=1912982 RepID=UPI00200804FA|nr:uncharacterized protein NEMAJ01_0449 [Nematocida major]KAH9385553.1 hypothetical protein NEMAJ01_0449 [Nematocida major]
MECVVDLSERIYIRREHLVCHTACNQILKVRFRRYSLIRPEVAIKYFRCVVKRFGAYGLDKKVVRLSKESKFLLEKIANKELVSTGILMSNLKTGAFARLGYVTDTRCTCSDCMLKECRLLTIKESNTFGYSPEDFKNIINTIQKKEKMKSKIKQQEALYNKFGIKSTRAIYDRFFGCYNLKGKRAGIRPFTLKGPWTKENANKLMHSYKTSLSIKAMSFFVILHKIGHPSASFITYNNSQIYYTLIVHKIDLKTKAELRQHIKSKAHVEKKEKNDQRERE